MGNTANTGQYYENIGLFYAMDMLHYESSKLKESIKRPNISQSLKTQWMWQHYAISEAINSIYDEPDIPPYITLETVADVYAKMSCEFEGTLSQRYAVVADTLFYYRDILKHGRVA